MKPARLFFIALILSTALTGCIARRADINLTVKSDDQKAQTATLDDSNSRYVSEPSAEFSLRLPNELTMTKDFEESGARLYGILPIEGNKQLRYMFTESTANSTAVAADLLAGVDGVTILRRESITKAGYQGIKVTAALKQRPGDEVPYYFLSAAGRTYVFTLPSGQPWEYFEAVIDSFKLN